MDSVANRGPDDGRQVDETTPDADAMRAMIGGLSPEARRDLRAVYLLLAERGLRRLVEHPERLDQIAAELESEQTEREAGS